MSSPHAQASSALRTPEYLAVFGLGCTASYTQLARVPVALHPGHPSNHGTFAIHCRTNNGVIMQATPLLGTMHRGAEKLLEVRDYRQGLALTDRHDWTSPFTSELGFALAVESLAGMQPPLRATWLRTLLAEITRIQSHLTFLTLFPTGPGMCLWEESDLREQWSEMIADLTGFRMHVMYCRLGGVAHDAPARWLASAAQLVGYTRHHLTELRARLDNPAVRALTEGVGVLDAVACASYGLPGLIERATGVPRDLRKDSPYAAYAELFGSQGPGRVVTASSGDIQARLDVMYGQLSNSLDMVEHCLDVLRTLPPGPVSISLPKVLKLPEASTYQATESAAGHNGYYLVSHGHKTPWRIKLRTHGFNAAASLEVAALGATHADLGPIVASLCLVMGDVDK